MVEERKNERLSKILRNLIYTKSLKTVYIYEVYTHSSYWSMSVIFVIKKYFYIL